MSAGSNKVKDNLDRIIEEVGLPIRVEERLDLPGSYCLILGGEWVFLSEDAWSKLSEGRLTYQDIVEGTFLSKD